MLLSEARRQLYFRAEETRSPLLSALGETAASGCGAGVVPSFCSCGEPGSLGDALAFAGSQKWTLVVNAAVDHTHRFGFGKSSEKHLGLQVAALLRPLPSLHDPWSPRQCPPKDGNQWPSSLGPRDRSSVP